MVLFWRISNETKVPSLKRSLKKIKPLLCHTWNAASFGEGGNRWLWVKGIRPHALFQLKWFLNWSKFLIEFFITGLLKCLIVPTGRELSIDNGETGLGLEFFSCFWHFYFPTVCEMTISIVLDSVDLFYLKEQVNQLFQLGFEHYEKYILCGGFWEGGGARYDPWQLCDTLSNVMKPAL